MGRVKKVTRTKMGLVIEEYRNGRYGAPGRRREKKTNPTPEQMEKRNQWQKTKRTWIRMMEYFGQWDYFSTLTYRRENRPESMEAAKEQFRRAREKIRREYKKRGYELKWVRNIEVGTKGAWHIHMVVNRIPDTDMILQAAWPHGKVVSQLMYERGSFRELAAYITKTPKTDPRLRESHFDCSRNMPLPESKKRIYKHWNREIRVPKGYLLDKESLWEGENPMTKYPCRLYLLIPAGRGKTRDG